MATNIITQEDLEIFKVEFFQQLNNEFKSNLLEELKAVLDLKEKNMFLEMEGKRFLKSYQVERMLGISAGTLQNLRINKTLPFSKIGGTIFYEMDDIQRLIKDNKRNAVN
jgi:hypothetical protein